MAIASTPALVLRLYVAGNAPNSRRAVANVTAICAQHFASAHEIEVIDLMQQPHLALANGIIVTPTLVKLSPPPIQRMIGDLSDTEQVRFTLASK